MQLLLLLQLLLLAHLLHLLEHLLRGAHAVVRIVWCFRRRLRGARRLDRLLNLVVVVFVLGHLLRAAWAAAG